MLPSCKQKLEVKLYITAPLCVNDISFKTYEKNIAMISKLPQTKKYFSCTSFSLSSLWICSCQLCLLLYFFLSISYSIYCSSGVKNLTLVLRMKKHPWKVNLPLQHTLKRRIIFDLYFKDSRKKMFLMTS